MNGTTSSFMDLTFHVQTFGCQMNKHDSERVTGMLESLGSSCVETIEDADVVVFMTCCVREAADVRLLGAMGISYLANCPISTLYSEPTISHRCQECSRVSWRAIDMSSKLWRNRNRFRLTCPSREKTHGLLGSQLPLGATTSARTA